MVEQVQCCANRFQALAWMLYMLTRSMQIHARAFDTRVIEAYAFSVGVLTVQPVQDVAGRDASRSEPGPEFQFLILEIGVGLALKFDSEGADPGPGPDPGPEPGPEPGLEPAGTRGAYGREKGFEKRLT